MAGAAGAVGAAGVAGAFGVATAGAAGTAGDPGAAPPGEMGDGAAGDGALSDPGEEVPGVPTLPGLTLENGVALNPTEDEEPVLGALPPPPPPINAVENPVPESTTCGICPPPGRTGFVITGFVSVGGNAR